jgi:chromosome segregation ATPase
MNQRETDTSEQVLKFAPKEKAPNRVAQLDEAGPAIAAQIRTAADLVKEDCNRAMGLAHKLSMELRAAEDRAQQMEREVEHWRERAARAEQWLRTIQKRLKRNCSRRSFLRRGRGRSPLVHRARFREGSISPPAIRGRGSRPPHSRHGLENQLACPMMLC